jgi:hypothetical protein
VLKWQSLRIYKPVAGQYEQSSGLREHAHRHCRQREANRSDKDSTTEEATRNLDKGFSAKTMLNTIIGTNTKPSTTASLLGRLKLSPS